MYHLIISAYLEIDISRSIAVVPHGEYGILAQNEIQSSPIIGPIIGDQVCLPITGPIIGDQVCLPIIIRDALNDSWLENRDNRFSELSRDSLLKNKLRFVPFKTFITALTKAVPPSRNESPFLLFLGPHLTLELTFDLSRIDLANILYERSSSFGGVTPVDTPYSLYEKSIPRYIQIAMIIKNHEKIAKLTGKEVLSFTQFKYVSLISGPMKRKPVHLGQRLSAHF